MSAARQFAKKLLQTSGLEVRRLPHGWLGSRPEPEWKPQLGPWIGGYERAKQQFVAAVLANADTMQRFRAGVDLPDRYGIGLDERCIEYSWALSRLEPDAKEILDAGSVLNNHAMVECPPIQGRNLHILTLAPEANCFWSKGISYLYASLLDTPIRDDQYDAIICISTLEHIGFDNFVFTGQHDPARPDDYLTAMREMRRILKPGGSLLLTVPFGMRQNFGAFRQLDLTLLTGAVDAFGPTRKVLQSFYQYTSAGWRLSSAADCSDCRYVDWVAEAWQGKPWPEPRPVELDFAAAARAVACVQLIKA
jgi:hypothetical protein